MSLSFDVCIVGAGVIGLSTALNVQKLMRQVNVTVIADSFGKQTNTPVLQSVFIPSPSTIEDDICPQFAIEWFTDAWDHHYHLATKEGKTSGNTLVKGTALWWHKGHHVIPQCVHDYRVLSREEMDEKEFNVAYGAEFTTVHVDLHDYLRWLLKEIRQNGGTVKHDTVFSMQELYGLYDVVVNCVGIRGRELKEDHDLHYTRSSMLQTTPIGIDNFLITQDDVYFCPHPRTGYCDVGFVNSYFNTDAEVDENTQWFIKHRVAQYLPEVKNCEVVNAWVEKRPVRFPILLEIEFINCNGPILPVVHNIGHGDKTISLAWGRGVQAAHLVQEVQRMAKPFAKKWQPYNKI